MAKFEKVNLLNYPIFFMTKETQCPYLENKSEKRLVTHVGAHKWAFCMHESSSF